MGGSYRLILIVLALMATVGLSLACAGDDSASLMVTPEASVTSEVQPSGSPSPEGSASALREAESVRTETGSGAASISPTTPTSGGAGRSKTVSAESEEPGSGTLKVIASRSVAIPSSSGSSVLLYGSHSSSRLSPQSAAVPGGLTVSAMGSVTVAADEAYLVIVPEQRYGPSGPEQMTDEDRQDILDALAALGVQEEEIEFSGLVGYGQASITVEVALDKLDELKKAIIDAVEEVIRRSESYGVLYGLSEENCESALSLARREAIPAAERAADDLAEALAVVRGDVMGALEYPLVNLAYGFASAGDLSCGSQSPSPYPNLVPFDAEPEVEVSVGLQITYGMR